MLHHFRFLVFVFVLFLEQSLAKFLRPASDLWPHSQLPWYRDYRSAPLHLDSTLFLLLYTCMVPGLVKDANRIKYIASNF